MLTRVFLSMMLTVALIPCAGHAAVAFSQPPASGNDAFLSVLSAQAADDFVLPSDGLVDGITWWGSYDSDPATLPPDQFIVGLFNDDGTGSPEVVPFFAVNASGNRMATALLDRGGAPVYEYDLTLSSPVSLMGAQPYFLAVINVFDQTDPSASWFWLLSDDTGESYFRFSINDSWDVDASGNMAFDISTAVPLPATFGLWLMGASLLGFMTKKRKA